MLALRDWLDDGGLAGLLADRTLPGAIGPLAHRAARLPRPAGALFRRAVPPGGACCAGASSSWPASTTAAIATRCASPSWPTSAAPAGDRAPSATSCVREALRRYVALLEALCRESPYNWFNFYDFWADDAAPDRHALSAAAALRAGRCACALRCRCRARAGGVRPAAADAAAGAGARAARRASPRQRTRRDARRTRCESSGTLSVHGARHLRARDAEAARARRWRSTATRVTLSAASRSRTMPLDAVPEAAVIVEAMRGTLTGNRAGAASATSTPRCRGNAAALDAGADAARAARCARRCASVQHRGPAGAGARGRRCAGRRRPLGDDDRAGRRRPTGQRGELSAPMTRLPARRARSRGAARSCCGWPCVVLAPAASPRAPLTSPTCRPSCRRRPTRRAGGAARPAAAAASRRALLLIGIEGGTRRARAARPRARWPRRCAPAALFEQVHNGDNAQLEADVGRLAVRAPLPAEPGGRRAALHAPTACATAIDETLSLLGTPAGAAIKPLLAARPDRRDAAHRRSA